MVAMIVRVYDELNRQRGDAANLLQQLIPLFRVEPGIHHEDSAIPHQKSGIGAGIVIGDVGVKARPDLLQHRSSLSSKASSKNKRQQERTRFAQANWTVSVHLAISLEAQFQRKLN